MPKIYNVRMINFGWYERKHGVLLENLPPNKRDILLENDFIKWIAKDAETIETIFRLEDIEQHERYSSKLYWNPYRKTYTTFKELESDSDVLDWNCAICDSNIKSRVGNKRIENFVCNTCSDSHNSQNKIIDGRIIESSNKFVRRCRNLLKREQREFVRYAKRSAES